MTLVALRLATTGLQGPSQAFERFHNGAPLHQKSARKHPPSHASPRNFVHRLFNDKTVEGY